MIKRLNKVTSLVVAAAAVSSLVPATGVMAADYKRVESKDGIIYEAVAYKDGNFYIDGNLKDGETDGAYLLSNGKYTDIEDVDTGSEVAIFGDKYLNVDNGDYFLDLSTGKVTDDDLAADVKDDVALALRKAIRNNADDRYSDHAKLDADSISGVKGNKFAETWFETSYNLEGKEATARVYTDLKGNYIDADYNLGKLKLEVGAETTAESVTLTNTEDTEKLKKSDAKVGATVKDAEVVAHDANYIYRIATIQLVGEGVDFNTVNGVEVNEDNTITVLQKISKAQASDDIDGAKYAKTVTTYSLEKDQVELFENAEGVSAFGNKVVVYNVEDTTVTAQTIDLKTTRGNYIVETNDSDELEDINAYDVDTDGNLWVLKSGFVYKFNNDEEFVKAYKVDGAMENLDVYDADNMVVWNEDDEVYSIVSGKSVSTEEDTEETVKAGWVQNADGTWCYFNNDGSQVKGQWLQLGGVWYYIKADGIMATGWEKVNGTWYYLQSSGAMKTGWLNDNGTWYYLQSSGAMKTGWLNDNGTWYYLQSNGAMKTGWLHDTDGNWYYLQSNGAMAKNTTIDGYRLGSNGAWIR
ncbi:MAG: N-acetylmuramoyl-L-alanine amidase family protein [Clostridium butyricum]|nr:N-acetylmuramoyl-L-alanine amidase family protein [Clostridium butyricum]